MIINLLWQSKENQIYKKIGPITPLLGTLRGEINDVGENLDLYLGADLAQEKEN